MKTNRARYENGSIRKVKRASGEGWEVRFQEAAEKPGNLDEIVEGMPQGLKPALILRHLRHD
jgi:hypothetical protein